MSDSPAGGPRYTSVRSSLFSRPSILTESSLYRRQQRSSSGMGGDVRGATVGAERGPWQERALAELASAAPELQSGVESLEQHRTDATARVRAAQDEARRKAREQLRHAEQEARHAADRAADPYLTGSPAEQRPDHSSDNQLSNGESIGRSTGEFGTSGTTGVPERLRQLGRASGVDAAQVEAMRARWHAGRTGRRTSARLVALAPVAIFVLLVFLLSR